MVGPKKRIRVPGLSEPEAAGLVARLDQRASSFVGQFGELESAIGMYFLARLFGWKVLVLVHNKRTIRKYEQILGIDLRKTFPPVGPLASKSVGLDVAEKAGQFWKAVSGDFRVPEKRDIES
jgi:hypothetical protein